MSHKTISLCMIVLNEDKFLAKALKNVKRYVDEIVVVDGGSHDKTIKIAKRHGAKVIESKWQNHFARQRNVSLKYATGKWILVMDADEICEKRLLESLQLFANNNIGADMFAFPRKNYLNGKQTKAYPDRQLRFFKNITTIKYQGKVHERPIGFKIITSAEKMHIIHRKSTIRQSKQNKYYRELSEK